MKILLVLTFYKLEIVKTMKRIYLRLLKTFMLFLALGSLQSSASIPSNSPKKNPPFVIALIGDSITYDGGTIINTLGHIG
uniref:hypothetical protein n=1 Tax=Shewanella gaetbuli TaxID=220752 RepID=UPI003B5B9661